jgi:hypothetical protein
MLYLREWRITVGVILLTLAGATGFAVPISYVINPNSGFGIQLLFTSIFIASALLIPFLAIFKIDGLVRTFAIFGLVLMVFGSATATGQFSTINGGGALLAIGMMFLTLSTGAEKYQLVMIPTFIVVAVFDYMAFIRPYTGALVCLLLIATAVRMLFYKSQKRLCVATAVSLLMMLPFFGSPFFGASSNQIWSLMGFYIGIAGVSVSALLGYMKLGELPDFGRAIRLASRTVKCPQCGHKTPKFFWLCGFCGFERKPQPSDLNKVVQFDHRSRMPFNSN